MTRQIPPPSHPLHNTFKSMLPLLNKIHQRSRLPETILAKRLRKLEILKSQGLTVDDLAQGRSIFDDAGDEWVNGSES